MSRFESKRVPRWQRIRKLKLRQDGGDVIELGRNDTIKTGVIHMENSLNCILNSNLDNDKK